VFWNVADNGWAQLAIRGAENTRVHGGAIALAMRAAFQVRLAALWAQALIYLQLCVVDLVFPSVAMAYAGYRAEEQVCAPTSATSASTPLPLEARKFYSTSKHSASGKR
jgi:hypothetical protein